MTFLLCDLQQATFARVNMDILNKIQGKYPLLLKQREKFTKASKLVNKPGYELVAHDALTHQKIPAYIGKRLDSTINIKEKFTPLNISKKPYFNTDIESVARGIEGYKRLRHLDNDTYKMGRALRKRKMTNEDKLMVDSDLYDYIEPIVKGKKPTGRDLADIKDQLKSRGSAKRLPTKTKGTKPTPTTIEEKKQRLTQKYGVK